jgi:hypothetical protein
VVYALFLISFFVSYFAHGADSFTQDTCSFELQQIDDLLSFTKLAPIDPSFSCLNEPFHFQQAYGSEDEYILVFVGIEMKSDDPGFLPFKTAWGLPAALYFSQKAISLKDKVKKSLNSFLSAERDIAACESCKNVILPSLQAHNLTEASLLINLLPTAKSCFGQAWGVIKNDIKNTVSDVKKDFDGAIRYIQKPTNPFAFLSSSMKQFKTVLTLFKDLAGLLPSLMPTLKLLPPNIGVDAVCNFAGTILPSIAITLITQGASKNLLVRAFSNLTLKLKKLVQMAKDLKVADKIVEPKKLRPLINGVLSCAAP